MHRGEVLFL